MTIYNDFGYITIDAERINATCNAYFQWKDLNNYLSDDSHRGINMPDAISEPMGCYCLGLLWNRGNEVGDATNPVTGQKIEFKATSRFEGDLSSFGPNAYFDDLVFLRFDIKNDLLYVYDLHISSNVLDNYYVNKTETFRQQKLQGRRPRTSLYKMFVETYKLTPDYIFNIRKCVVYKKGTIEYNKVLR